MKKLIFTISTILLLSVAIFAQTYGVKPIEWILLLPENEEFSVNVPENFNLSASGKNKEFRQYSGTIDGAYFFIFSDDLKGDYYYYKNTLDFIEVNQKAELEKQQNSDTMKFKFSDDEDFFHTIYTVKTDERAYIFHMVSEKQNDPNVVRFFKSLKINGKPAAIEFEKENAKSNSENKDSAQSTTTSENVSGYGRGSGIGNGTNDSSQNIQPVKSTVLNILTKPKPKYTDFARSYSITGNVKMRVTFLSDGTIGATIPITKLPFGLTKSSIEAAKQMRFDPMTVDEKPVTVTKVVVFNFTIY